MTTNFAITIPESLTTQMTELEAALANIIAQEATLITQRKDIEIALHTLATGIAVLSGQPIPQANVTMATTTRKQMSPEAKQRIADGLKKSREAKALAALNPAERAEALNLAELNRPALTDEAKAELDKKVAALSVTIAPPPAAVEEPEQELVPVTHEAAKKAPRSGRGK